MADAIPSGRAGLQDVLQRNPQAVGDVELGNGLASDGLHKRA
jgi:hypothetical protein